VTRWAISTHCDGELSEKEEKKKDEKGLGI
jgi:hypothetical protein